MTSYEIKFLKYKKTQKKFLTGEKKSIYYATCSRETLTKAKRKADNKQSVIAETVNKFWELVLRLG